jgi:hypothetical protein
MRLNEYSHRHGKELLQILHPEILKEIQTILTNLKPFPHGAKKGITVKKYITDAFVAHGWEKEGRADFRTDKKDHLDLCKWKVAIEMEFSRFEMFFRDFFRFMLLHQRREIDVGIILTLDDMAYERWAGEAKAYKSARASFQRLVVRLLSTCHCGVLALSKENNMFIGFAILICGFIFMIWFSGNVNKPRYSRPMAFSNPIVVGMGTILWLSLVFAGISLVYRSSTKVGRWAFIASVILYFMIKLVGGTKNIGRIMLNTYQKVKTANPNDNEHEILCKVLKLRYPSWSDEEIHSFVGDNKNISDLTNMVIYHETGKYQRMFK